MTLDPATALTMGIVLLIVPTIAYGGTFLLRTVRGTVPANGLQQSFFRAGHAHAGVLVILGLVVQLAVSAEGVPALARSLSAGVLWAAVLMSAGFFLSVIGKDPRAPNRLIILLWLGGAALVIGVLAAGVGLIIASS